MSLRPSLPWTAPNCWVGVKKGWNETSDWPWDQLVSLPAKDLMVHALVLGASGSGKTNLILILIAQAILEGRSICVIDMRGDLVSTILALCSGHVPPDRIKLIDLRAGHSSHGFNPLCGSGEPYFRALGFCAAIEQASLSFGVQIAEYLRNAIMVLAWACKPVTELERVFYDRAFRLACLDVCLDERVVAFWHRYDGLKPENQAGLASPVMNKVSILTATPKLTSVLAHPNPIDLGAHINGDGKVLLFSGALDELHSGSRIMTHLFLSSLFGEVLGRVPIPESKRIPLTVIVDEFSNFESEDFESVLVEGRRFRCSLVLGLQTLAQFSPRMRSAVLGTVGAKCIFRLGREDSTIMSRDLANDPRRFDFTAFQTGDCILWRRGQKLVEIEVNEPLITDLDDHQADIRRLVAEMIPEDSQQPQLKCAAGFQLDSPRRKSTTKPRPLEDWLCE